MSNEIHERIKSMVTSYPIMLFMKGTPDAPQCGFSSRVAMVLKDIGKPFASFDVLSDPTVRQGIKEYGKLADNPSAVRQRRVGGWQ